jgi:hypothetical protein
MSTYEALMLCFTFGLIIVAVITQKNNNSLYSPVPELLLTLI